VSCKATQKIAKKWSLDYIAHGDSGHDLPLDSPEWLIERLDEWFTETQNNKN
jgi:hypothetical protein